MKHSRPLVPHPTDPSLVLVPLTHGHWATIDAAHAIEIGRWNWHLVIRQGRQPGRDKYAYRTQRKNKRYTSIGLHVEISRLCGVAGETIDHINGNGLDCRMANMRAATKAQNCQNRFLPVNNSSGVKGVSWHKAEGKWAARVGHGKHRVTIGYFRELGDATKAICAAREAMHGEFANHGRN